MQTSDDVPQCLQVSLLTLFHSCLFALYFFQARMLENRKIAMKMN